MYAVRTGAATRRSIRRNHEKRTAPSRTSRIPTIPTLLSKYRRSPPGGTASVATSPIGPLGLSGCMGHIPTLSGARPTQWSSTRIQPAQSQRPAKFHFLLVAQRADSSIRVGFHRYLLFAFMRQGNPASAKDKNPPPHTHTPPLPPPIPARTHTPITANTPARPFPKIQEYSRHILPWARAVGRWSLPSRSGKFPREL